MRKFCLFLFCLLPAKFSFAQLYKALVAPSPFTKAYMDSLGDAYRHEKNDSSRVVLLNILARGYLLLKNTDSGKWCAQEALEISQKIKYTNGQLEAATYLVKCLWQAGNYSGSLDYAFRNLRLAESTKDSLAIYDALRQVCFSYANMKDWQELLKYARRSRSLVHSGIFRDANELHFRMLSGYINFMGSAFGGLNNTDSALYFRRLGYRLTINVQTNHNQGMAIAAAELAETFLQINEPDSASFYYKMAIPYAEKSGIRNDLIGECQLGLAKIYKIRDQYNAALYYSKSALVIFKSLKLPANELETMLFLQDLYAKHNEYDSAYIYQSKTIALTDSLFNQQKIKAIDSIKYGEALSREQLMQQTLRHQVAEANMQKNLQVVKLEKAALVRNTLAICVLVLVFAGVLFFRNMMLKRKNQRMIIEKKEAEIEHQKSELETQALLAEMNQVLKLQQMRTRIASDLHDDIGSTLTSISYYSELVKMQLKEDDASLTPMLDKIGGSARNTVNAMSDIVWIINPRNDTIENLVTRMKHYAAEMLGERNIQYTFNTNDEIRQLELNMQQRKNVYLIYKEAVHNAVKYSACSKIELDFTATNHQINLSITDNGKGFDTQHAGDGNGLINMQKRAEEINAHFEICSAQDKGMRIKLTCKIT